MSKTKTLDEFILRSLKVHNNKYSYTRAEYKNNISKVIITCPIHGDFKQTPSHHLNGHGCPACANALKKLRRLKPLAQFIKEATSVHCGKYTYDNVIAGNSKTKVSITCSIHGDFMQAPHDHVRGHGCPKCGTYGFKLALPAILYYISINNGQAYKIGVTNKELTGRFLVTEMKNIKVLFTETFATGVLAKEKEQQILNEFKEHRYTGAPLLTTGNTELFNKDVLKKDTNEH